MIIRYIFNGSEHTGNFSSVWDLPIESRILTITKPSNGNGKESKDNANSICKRME